MASKVNNERKLPGHRYVYAMELQQICSTKGNATSSHCAFTQFIGSHSATGSSTVCIAFSFFFIAICANLLEMFFQ